MRICTVGLGVILMAGSALGQEAPAKPDKAPPLQGPRVQENRAPHVQDEFSEGMRTRTGPQIPMRQYSQVIAKLRGEQAPADLRLSEEQEHKLGAIEKEYRDAARAFAEQQREQNRNRDGQNQPDNQRRRREAAQEMMRSGPRASDHQTRIWAVLSEKQQAFVKVELDKIREEMEKRRSEEYMKRRIEQQRDARQPARPDAQGRPAELARPGAEAERPLRERVQRLMRQLAQLPDDQREALLQRLEAEMDRRGIPDEPPTDRPPAPRR